uniref:Protein shisa-5 n=1 Tax=Schizaphis graminum TaxID=13262 RepID=A0A2S2NMD9_SCHGA
MSAVKRIVSVAYLLMVVVTLVQCENCTVKKTSNGTFTRERLMTCPSSESAKDAKFCCYDKYDSVDCCNGADHLRHIILKYMPDLLTLLIIIVGLILTCCIFCICIPCYCIMSRRRPIYKDSNDNANMVAAVSLPNESQEQNIPKKEVTHHLPPGAYPVYPQFMGMQPLKSTEVNC